MTTFAHSFKAHLFEITEDSFTKRAIELFKYQAEHNLIYQKYLQILQIDSKTVNSVEKIPFLPIDFFKQHEIKTGNWDYQCVFESSGTTGQITSKHFVRELPFYHQVAQWIFEKKYGPLKEYIFLALLPSYLERTNSSLVEMIRFFIEESKSTESGFYLSNVESLIEKLKSLVKKNKKIILWGVTFALLDLADKYSIDLSSCIIMETGGMKGRKEESTREEVHTQLKKSFQVQSIHSEYGMTELFSQAYSKDNGLFQSPPWMKILIREINDPFKIIEKNKRGGINIIDLANVDTCAFIETQDIGEQTENGFKVLGRIDHSDLRGCSLMI